MLGSENYEHTLAEYRDKQGNPEIRNTYVQREQLLTAAIDDAYDFQERLLEKPSVSGLPSLQVLFETVLSKYRGQSSMWFTLNHDLLVEKMWKRMQVGNLICPGVPRYLGSSHWLPDTGEIDEFEDAVINPNSMETNYIKLHGSKNWHTSTETIKRRAMIAGGQKHDQILQLPGSVGNVLRSYFDFFNSSIQSETIVLTIGYSFSDIHINETLAREGVKLFVIDPAGFPKVVAGGGPVRNALMRNLIGFWPLRYADVFGTLGAEILAKEMVADLLRLLDPRS